MEDILNQGEFPGLIRTREQFSNHIENILNKPSAFKQLRSNRTGYRHQETGTVITRNPHALDGGTAFHLGMDLFIITRLLGKYAIVEK